MPNSQQQHQALMQATIMFLQSKNATLWGQSFNIGPEGRLIEAAEWFTDQIEDFGNFMEQLVAESEDHESM